jgi:hypothetical protein
MGTYSFVEKKKKKGTYFFNDVEPRTPPSGGHGVNPGYLPPPTRVKEKRKENEKSC